MSVCHTHYCLIYFWKFNGIILKCNFTILGQFEAEGQNLCMYIGVDLYSAWLWNSSLKRLGWLVLKGSHSFICHPHVHGISHPAFTPNRRASPHFGPYLLSVPQRVGGWVGVGGWLHTEVACPPEDGSPSHYLYRPIVRHPGSNSRPVSHKSDALTTRLEPPYCMFLTCAYVCCITLHFLLRLLHLEAMWARMASDKTGSRMSAWWWYRLSVSVNRMQSVRIAANRYLFRFLANVNVLRYVC